MKIIWSPTAISNMESLRLYISEHNPQGALKVAVSIHDAIDLISQFPSLGRVGRVPNSREYVMTDYPYIISYSISERVLQIIAVMHTAKSWSDF